MIPCLYESTETAYTTNGIGKLSDCISCIVTEKRNSSYELAMEYPSDGIHAKNLVDRNIILAKPAEEADAQAFRIYLVTTDLTGTIKVNARHVSYELNFITASSVSGNSALTSLQSLKQAATTNCAFSFTTDIDSAADMSVETPDSLRNILGGVDGSILDTYGGELEWDMYNVILHKERGADNGVRIVYGKNLSDFKMDENSGETITGVHPFWLGTVYTTAEVTEEDEDGEESVTGITYSEDTVLVELPEKVIMAEGANDYRIKILDCSSIFDEQPSVSELRAYAKSYLENTTTTVPELDITIDFIQLWQLPGYEDIAEAERVHLCDTVYVYIKALGVEVSSKVTETVYDVLLERYESITLSNSLSTSSHNLLSTLSDYTTALVNKKLAYYTTTSELSTKLEVNEGQILLEVSEIYATYAQLEETQDAIADSVDTKLKSYYTIDETQSYVQVSLESISSVVSSTTTAVTNLTTTVTSISTSVSGLESDVSSLETSVSGISSDVSSLQTSVEDVSSDVSALQSSVGDVISDVSSLESAVETVSSDVSSLETSVSGITSDVSSLGTTVSGISTNVSTLGTTVNGISSDVSSLETTVSGITSDVSSLESSVSGISSDVSTLGTTVSGISSDVSSLGTTVSGISSDVSSLESSVSGISSDVSSLETSVNDISSDVSSLQSSVNDISSDVSDLESSVSKINTSITTINTSITTLNTKYSEVVQTQTSITTRVTGLESSLEETYQTITNETDEKLESYYTAEETESYVDVSVKEISSVVSDTTTRVESLEEVVEDPETGLAAVYSYMNSETEKLWTEIEQLPDSVQIAINATYQSLVATDESIQSQLNEYSTYFSFTSDGLKISESDSAFALLLGPSKISFLESDSEVAYISESMLYIYDAYILNALRIGDFQWQPDSDSRLNLVKVG